MKGQIEVLGTNHGLRAFEGFKGEGSLLSVDKDHHCLMLGEEKLFYQIYRNNSYRRSHRIRRLV